MANAREPLSVIVAAPAEAPGVADLFEAAVAEARAGAPVRMILTDLGLAVLTTTWPERLLGAGVDVSICSRSAREKAILPATVPPSVHWSSLTAFLRDEVSVQRLWSAFP